MIFTWNWNGTSNHGVGQFLFLWFSSHCSTVNTFRLFSVPLVSRILPSDICKIYKSGANIRLDTTLVDFSDMRWERGDISFIFNGDAKPNESLTVLDNILKVYQKVRYEVKCKWYIDNKLDL